MRKMLRSLVLALFLSAPALTAQEAHHHDSPHGLVEFPVSCRAEVRASFQEAVAMLHSFGYEDARRVFETIARQDPACGMAHWGVAMTYWHPLWAQPTLEELASGTAAASHASELGADTERERAYIAAIGSFYQDADRQPHGVRAQAYRAAMEEVLAAAPEDDEAAIFHALAILGSARPGDATYTDQKQAADILGQLLPGHPDHPGIAHYTIHAFDYPELAELALPAARAYAEIAPESPHARHMPTHIFTRLGLWQESIAANLGCKEAAEALMDRNHPGATAFESLHCQDYLAYAYLQRGEDERARQVLQEVSAARRFDDPSFVVGYAMLAVPARYALERRDWSAAAGLRVPDVALRWEDFLYTHAITHFANALGAARLGDALGARTAVDALEEVHGVLAADPPGGPYDWAAQVESQWTAARGWLAFVEGKHEEAVRWLAVASEQEEAAGKHPVTPGAILPAREQLGDLLMELGRAREALGAYEAALSEAPRRFNGLAGAARAARAVGDVDKAAELYRALLDVAGASRSRAATLLEAREYLAGAGAD
jgi:tetratricopeptide (TPR) repeat protein